MEEIKEDSPELPSTQRRKAPEHNLKQAISFLEKLHGALGKGPFDRESIAKGLGHVSLSGPAGQKIGALLHFGLLDSRKGTCSVSALGLALLRPISEQERQAALITACKSPSLYMEIFKDFSGQSMPSLFSNVLARKYGVSLGSAESVAGTFRESATFAGLLNNGVLGEAVATVQLPPDSSSQSQPANSDGSMRPKEKAAAGTSRFAIPLSKKRVGSLELPLPLSAADLERIRGWLDLMAEVLTEESAADADDVGGITTPKGN